jgi:lipooligosaccharide transport system permease protein
VIPIIFLTGLVFSALGLIVTALAPSYDFFMYYFTLFVTPTLLLSGVFFPLEQLPPTLQHIAAALPLAHAVHLARPLIFGELPDGVAGHVVALVITATLSYWVALALVRRRLLK